MSNQYDLVQQLTSSDDFDRSRWLNDFAFELGWHPSDRLDAALVNDIATSHLLVEHGMENTAVISFLRYPREFSDLDLREKNRLLSISYNNLVDWHIHVELNYVTFVYNRIEPVRIIDKHRISRDKFDALHSSAFEQIIGRRLNPNLPALDDALIETISFWKRNLSAELGYAVSNEALSELFNTIIFIRAIEDHRKRIYRENHHNSPSLVQVWREESATVKNVLFSFLVSLTNGNVPDFLGDESRLSIFDDLDRRTVSALFTDFYSNKYAPYPYDFSLMSKHALSRIYEHYVSILRVEESPQQSFPFLPRLPQEEQAKVYGSYYTPQYIARFFARYLREQMPPRQFRNLRVADPACGSGIFLRTLLELQCDPVYSEVTTSLIRQAFENVLGIDVDENATRATQLSLSLLYQVLTDELPEQLNIISAEALQFFLGHPETRNSFDAVIANPPFVSWDNLSLQMREQVTKFMGNNAGGRVDLNLAFLLIGLEMLKPGGFGLFILPHTFLLKESSQGVRQIIAENCWLRCLVDLSAIPVFGEVGTYVTLLIFQKKPAYAENFPAPAATIVKCQDFVGRALQEAVEGKQIQNSFYSIHSVPQSTFNEQQQWLIIPPAESAIQRKMSRFAKLKDFLKIRQGLISGADKIFILPSRQVPVGEELIFAPFLPDREMQAYTVPTTPSRFIFYPYVDGEKIDGELLRGQFPKTWAYLNRHRDQLSNRGSLRNSNKEWWEPIRPRVPEHMLRPKIISPHLVLVPRFSYDATGEYAISRSPLMYVENIDDELNSSIEHDLLKYFLAILNSSPCYWFISTHSHVYSKGYVMLEPRTLNMTPVPSPDTVHPSIMNRLINLIDRRLENKPAEARQIEKEVDVIVADLYQLTAAERRAIGME